jgi:hypothetical protein
MNRHAGESERAWSLLWHGRHDGRKRSASASFGLCAVLWFTWQAFRSTAAEEPQILRVLRIFAADGEAHGDREVCCSSRCADARHIRAAHSKAGGSKIGAPCHQHSAIPCCFKKLTLVQVGVGLAGTYAWVFLEGKPAGVSAQLRHGTYLCSDSATPAALTPVPRCAGLSRPFDKRCLPSGTPACLSTRYASRCAAPSRRATPTGAEFAAHSTAAMLCSGRRPTRPSTLGPRRARLRATTRRCGAGADQPRACAVPGTLRSSRRVGLAVLCAGSAPVLRTAESVRSWLAPRRYPSCPGRHSRSVPQRVLRCAQ